MAGTSPAKAGSGEADSQPPGGKEARREKRFFSWFIRGETFYLLSIPRYWPGARTIVPRGLKGLLSGRRPPTETEKETRAAESQRAP